MQNLIDFLKKNFYWLVFVLLEVISLISLFKYNTYQGGVFFSTANTVVGGVYDLSSRVSAFLTLADENELLEAENEQLRRQLNDLKAAIRKRDDALSFAADTLQTTVQSYHFVHAKVVSSTLHKSRNLLTIDKGTHDGVQPEMGVVCSRGVVGIVYQASQHYAVVMPLLNVNSHVSCRLQGSEYFGTMQWRQGNPNVSYAEGVPRHAEVRKGCVIETNGYSDIFPEGFPIGKVLKVGDSSDGMSYSLTVQLFTDFKSLRNVSVITDYTNLERNELEQRADSLMMEMTL